MRVYTKINGRLAAWDTDLADPEEARGAVIGHLLTNSKEWRDKSSRRAVLALVHPLHPGPNSEDAVQPEAA